MVINRKFGRTITRSIIAYRVYDLDLIVLGKPYVLTTNNYKKIKVAVDKF